MVPLHSSLGNDVRICLQKEKKNKKEKKKEFKKKREGGRREEGEVEGEGEGGGGEAGGCGWELFIRKSIRNVEEIIELENYHIQRDKCQESIINGC